MCEAQTAKGTLTKLTTSFQYLLIIILVSALVCEAQTAKGTLTKLTTSFQYLLIMILVSSLVCEAQRVREQSSPRPFNIY